MSTRNYLTLTKKYKRAISSQHSLYRLINSSFDIKGLLLRLSKLLCQVMEAAQCTVILLDNTKQYADLKCAYRINKRIIVERRGRLSNYLEKEIAKTATPVNKGCVMAAPLMSEDIIGIVILKRGRHQQPFDSVDQDILSMLVTQVSMGIKNIQLYEEQQKLILGSIKSMVKLLDAKVPREYTHTPYFSKLVGDIAHQMRLNESDIRILKYASMLHDVGKIDIPSEILMKPTPLTKKEFGLIKGHPVAGAKMFKPLQILKPVIPIILHHHEKYDGQGYPSGLKKGRIPLGARIMSVADAFEAMVFGRPYKERMNVIQAVNEIKRQSGSQFDPKVVDAFLKVLKSFRIKKYLKRERSKVIMK
ncbi:MAG: HD domain-containing protein [Candidatus Omnitrophica bacterium]|nr:HD domain-containing protein [Candidatus Omnitrophota bacterium]